MPTTQMAENITLQINLSPGDVNYAGLTVPALVKQHPDIGKRLLVVDCCRPQKTKLVNPDTKYPLAAFNENVERITAISNALLKNKTVTDVYYLKPGDGLFKHLAKKYLNNVYDCTHGAGGTANMSYWAGMELPETRYVLHYDGDMLLYQKPGYLWYHEALDYLANDAKNIFAVPRLCPPVNYPIIDAPSLHEGRPFEALENYWKNDWFSTRHFLFDKQKLAPFLPLVRGQLMLELLLRKYGRRAFPLDPEIVLFRSVGGRGGKKIILKNTDAWLLHPATKPQAYLNLLPQLIEAVTNGKTPDVQRGNENINLEAWMNYFEKQ